MVQVYNDYKGGVDIADAGATRYLYQQKIKRWTKTAQMFVFKMAIQLLANICNIICLEEDNTKTIY